MESQQLMRTTLETLVPFTDILLAASMIKPQDKDIILNGISQFLQNWNDYIWPNLRDWLLQTSLKCPQTMIQELSQTFPFLKEFEPLLFETLVHYKEYWHMFYERVKEAKKNLA